MHAQGFVSLSVLQAEQASGSWEVQLNSLEACLHSTSGSHSTSGATSILLDVQTVQVHGLVNHICWRLIHLCVWQRALSVLWSRLELAAAVKLRADLEATDKLQILESRVEFLDLENNGLRKQVAVGEAAALQLEELRRDQQKATVSPLPAKAGGQQQCIACAQARNDLETLNAYLGDLETELEQKEDQISSLNQLNKQLVKR